MMLTDGNTVPQSFDQALQMVRASDDSQGFALLGESNMKRPETRHCDYRRRHGYPLPGACDLRPPDGGGGVQQEALRYCPPAGQSTQGSTERRVGG